MNFLRNSKKTVAIVLILYATFQLLTTMHRQRAMELTEELDAAIEDCEELMPRHEYCEILVRPINPIYRTEANLGDI